MEYTTLNNGVKMPMAGIGTFLLTPDEAEASVLSALQCGYRLIDTANAYVHEKAVGRAMKKSGLKREEIFLETKLWPSFYEQADAVEKTLERLDTAEQYFSHHAVSIRHRFVLWCQGETDGDLGTSPEAYEEGFLSLRSALLTHGMEHLFLIRIGCFNDMSQKAGSPDDRSRKDAALRNAASSFSVPGNAAGRDQKQTVPDYAPIRAAQEHLALTCPDVTMVSRLFSGMREQGLMKDAFHYYQHAYNLVGEDAGRHAAEYVRSLR